MKRKLSIMLFLLVVSTIVSVAQEGLNVAQRFDGRYRKKDNATEILVKGKNANNLKLTLYRSITLNEILDEAKEIGRLVTSDGVSAVNKEVEYRDGELYYGFYVLAPMVDSKDKKKINRYLFYLNQKLNNVSPENKVLLIYLEGWATPDYVKSLISE